jgi:hypothetical protein
MLVCGHRSDSQVATREVSQLRKEVQRLDKIVYGHRFAPVLGLFCSCNRSLLSQVLKELDKIVYGHRCVWRGSASARSIKP